MTQRQVWFDSGTARCRATIVLPEPVTPAATIPRPTPPSPKPPVIVMSHGLGASHEMGLSHFAERFVRSGYACLVFDHRHFGASEGEPRQLLVVSRQLADWQAAIGLARSLPEVDGDKVILWGTSFGGGNVIATAASRPPGVVAAIAQTPFTDGLESALVANPVSAARSMGRALVDSVLGRVGVPPRRVPLSGPPGSVAVATSPTAVAGIAALTPPGAPPPQLVARSLLHIAVSRPGRRARQIDVPILFAIAEADTVVPTGGALRAVARAPRGEYVTYVGADHFDLYAGPVFEDTIADQLDFLSRHVPVAVAAPPSVESPEKHRPKP